MSSENENISQGLSGFSLDPDLTGCHTSGQSGPPYIKELVENELVGVPLHVQKDTLHHLIHLLGKKNANHQKKI